jgi:AcrR family transcriptional regulator
MRKGEQTRAAIVDAALELAGRDGLEGLTIGLVADRMRMSKSGVFAHFGSREDLQIAVLKEYEKRFVEGVLLPSLNEARGLPRLEAMYSRWVDRTSVEIASLGCIYVSGAVEYDDRPGPIRDELVGMIRSWQAELMRAIKQAIEEGHLRSDTDPMQLIFVIEGLVLSVHFNARLMHNKESITRARAGFAQWINAHRAPAQSPLRLAPRNRNL